MHKVQCILEEIRDKYSEYFEMEGDKSPLLMCKILSFLLMKEREKSNHLQKKIDHFYKTTTRY